MAEEAVVVADDLPRLFWILLFVCLPRTQYCRKTISTQHKHTNIGTHRCTDRRAGMLLGGQTSNEEPD